ncbi:MAG: hypothetical protein PHN53_11360 [Eubacteriales bacterium]|nr:hypothetical protein [Eubacteriales bacterium]
MEKAPPGGQTSTHFGFVAGKRQGKDGWIALFQHNLPVSQTFRSGSAGTYSIKKQAAAKLVQLRDKRRAGHFPKQHVVRARSAPLFRLVPPALHAENGHQVAVFVQKAAKRLIDQGTVAENRKQDRSELCGLRQYILANQRPAASQQDKLDARKAAGRRFPADC